MRYALCLNELDLGGMAMKSLERILKSIGLFPSIADFQSADSGGW
jgi:hypothetical protein